MSKKDEVRKASNQFYAALNNMTNGDAESLKKIWSHNAAVTTMHPIGGRQVGWDEVWEAWEQTGQVASDGHVELQDQLIRVVGKLAYEVGTEVATFKIAGKKVEGQIRVTNIYRKKSGKWKVVHHHTDVAPAMVEVMKQLQAAT